jgi:hypothetical protein
MYAFKCPKCSHADTFMLPIKNRYECPTCIKCSTDNLLTWMERDVALEGAGTLNKEYDKPILSDTMGVAPAQVAERRAKFPHIPHTDDGRVIIRNLAEQNRFSKELGFQDRN